jgi:hypothetical protein
MTHSTPASTRQEVEWHQQQNGMPGHLFLQSEVSSTAHVTQAAHMSNTKQQVDHHRPSPGYASDCDGPIDVQAPSSSQRLHQAVILISHQQDQQGLGGKDNALAWGEAQVVAFNAYKQEQ